MKGNVRNRVNLRIERNQMVTARDKRERVSKNETAKRSHSPDRDSLPKKNFPNLLPARPQGTKNGNVPRFIGDCHRENHENVQPGYEGDQSDKNRGD